VAHRLVLDYPDRVRNMCLLDIAPTLYMYEHTNMDFVRALPAVDAFSRTVLCALWGLLRCGSKKR
jgi:pimeloyl-ACP methyl ester carboxylesterase